MTALWHRHSQLLALGAALTSLSVAAQSQTTTYPFDLPAQPLAESLRAVGHLTSTNVMFEPRLVKNLRAPALRTQTTTSNVIRKLLEGTQLDAVQTSRDSILIIAAASGDTVGDSRSEVKMFTGSSSPAEGYIRIAASSQAAPAAREPVTSKEEPKPVELEELIVTAERLGRSVLETSTSVVVIDAEALTQRSADSIKDLVSSIPNISTAGRSSLAPSVRGVDGTGPALGADAFFAGTRPRLNIQVDGRPTSYNEVVFGDFGVWDLQQVEVLRGPQSTLQGRNSIAGTVAVKTADPTYDFQAKARVVGGNYDTRQYSGALSAPIVDGQVAFRLSADHRTSQSFLDYTPFPNGRKPGEYEGNVYRAKLLVQPSATPDFSTLLTVNHTDFRGPQAELVAGPDYERHVNRFDVPDASVFEPRSTSGILDLNWKANETLALQTLVSYADLSIERFARPGVGNATIDGHELLAQPSVTLRSSDERFKGVFGTYFFRASQDEYIDLFGGGGFSDSTKTNAVFGEGTYKFSDAFDVTLGARYEEEHRERDGSIYVFAIDLDEKYSTFLPKLVLSWHPSKTSTVGALVTRGYNGGSAGFTFFPPFVAYTFEPEYVWNYEGFARTILADGRLSLSGNVFYSDYEDMQLPFQLGVNSVVVRNADQVTTYGAEIMAAWSMSKQLKVSASLGTTQSDIKSFPNSGAEGNELPRAPKVTGSLGISYVQPDGLDFSFDARYSGGYFSSVLNEPRGRVGSYWGANSQLGYTFRNVKVFAYGRNLFDKQEPLQIYPNTITYATIMQPRTYGVGAQVNF